MKVQDKIAVVTGGGGGLGEGIAPKDALDMMVDMQIPFKKYQTPEDIGKAVTFLSSSEAEEITGQSLNICGGMAFN